jgi:hypothetical protein
MFSRVFDKLQLHCLGECVTKFVHRKPKRSYLSGQDLHYCLLNYHVNSFQTSILLLRLQTIDSFNVHT